MSIFTTPAARDYGTCLAEFQVGASLSPSHARDKLREEAQAGNEEVSQKYDVGGDAGNGVHRRHGAKARSRQASSERACEGDYQRSEGQQAAAAKPSTEARRQEEAKLRTIKFEDIRPTRLWALLF